MRLWLALLVAAGCSKGTYVVVTVDSAQPLVGIRALAVHLTLGGRTADKRIAPSSGITLPANFAVEVTSGSGNLDVHLDALGDNDVLLSSGDGSAQISAGKSVSLSILLGGGTLDLGPQVDANLPDGSDGGGGQLTASPSHIDLNPTAATAAHTREVTITNAGPTATTSLVTLLSGADVAVTGFGLNGCDGKTLLAGESCTLQVIITPPAPGSFSALLTVHDNSGHEALVPITAVAVNGTRLTIGKMGNGAGLITTTDINCGGTCTFLYPPGTQLTLTAAPDVSSTFGGWTQPGCTGTTCDVTMSSDLTVGATFSLKPIQVALTVTGSGSVTSTPAGITNCTGTCNATFLYGQALTLTATPQSTTYVTAWAGLTCAGGICNSMPTADVTAKVNFDPKPANFVFLTSTKQKPGELGGVAGANTICNTRAAAGGLGGSYVAWLSSTTTDAKDALTGSGGWVRRDGLPFANTVADLLAGKIWYPVVLDESGNAFAGNNIYDKSPPTFTGRTGLKQDTDPVNNCGNYTMTGNSNSIWAGRFGGGSYEWTESSAVDCNAPVPLLCFGVGQNVTVSVPARPVGARLAFPLTAADFNPSTGVNAADTLCKTAAQTAALPNFNNYLAYLAPDDTHNAGTRFNAASGAWYRPDDVKLVANAADLLLDTPSFMSAPDVLADKSHALSYIEIVYGRSNAGGRSPQTCSGWTSSTNMDYAESFYGNTINSFNYSLPCSNMGRVLCVQN